MKLICRLSSGAICFWRLVRSKSARQEVQVKEMRAAFCSSILLVDVLDVDVQAYQGEEHKNEEVEEVGGGVQRSQL